jgi:hypothetical protein
MYKQEEIIMANITLSIPDDLHMNMRKFSEIRWSAVARKAIQKKVKDLEMMDKLTSKSVLTEKDVEEISNKINKRLAKKILS